MDGSNKHLSTQKIAELIEIHRRNLEVYREQSAKFGALYVPPHILGQIEAEESNINKLQQTLEQRLTGEKTTTIAIPAVSSNLRNDLLQARIFVNRRQIPEARAWIQRILLTDSSIGEAWYLLGSILNDKDAQNRAYALAEKHGYSMTKKRDRSIGGMWIFIAFTVFLGLLSTLLVTTAKVLRETFLSGSFALGGIALLALVCFLLFSFTQIREAWTTNRQIAQQARRQGYSIIMIGTIVMSFLVIIRMIAIGRQYVLTGVINQEQVTSLAIVAVGAFLLFAVIGPFALVELAPEIALSQQFSKFFDFVMAIVGIILAVLVFFSRNFMPLGLVISIAIVSVVLLIIVWISYRRGDSFFDAMLDVMNITKQKPEILPQDISELVNKSRQSASKLPKIILFFVAVTLLLSITLIVLRQI